MVEAGNTWKPSLEVVKEWLSLNEPALNANYSHLAKALVLGPINLD
jgi:hypothetical protein